MDYSSGWSDAPSRGGDHGSDGGDLRFLEVPRTLEVLPDGREGLVTGDPERCRHFNHFQGDNPEGFRGTCGLVSCEDVLRQFGIDSSEAQVVEFATGHGLCDVSDSPESSGGTTTEGQAEILTDLGVPSHVENGQSLEQLASDIEEGHGVIIEVNAGYLWNDANYVEDGSANHAIVVTGVSRDPTTGDIQGFFVNDSGVPPAGSSGQFVSADAVALCWSSAGGSCVVTDPVLT